MRGMHTAALALGVVSATGCNHPVPPLPPVTDPAALRREATAPGADDKRLLLVGERLRRAGEYGPAAEVISRVAQLTGGSELTRAALIDVTVQLGRPEEAMTLAEEALRTFPTSAEVKAAQCLAMVDLKQFRAAVELGRLASESAPESPRAWRAYARALAAGSRTSDAITAFERAASFAPDDGGLLADYGAMLSLGGQAEKATRTLEEAVRLQPRNASAHRLLGRHLCERASSPAETESGLGHLRSAVTLAPESSMAHASLGEGLLRAGKALEAEGELRSALALDPARKDVLLPLAQCQQALGQKEAARSTFAKHRRFVDLRRDIGHLETRLAVTPASSDLLLRLAQFYEENDEPGRAALIYKRAFSLKPLPEIRRKLLLATRKATESAKRTP